jgi:hypothetical protein
MDMEQVRECVWRLVEEHRSRCLWFLREDFRPTSREEALRVLEQIKRHGDRRAFEQASELEAWLSRNTSAASAAS